MTIWNSAEEVVTRDPREHRYELRYEEARRPLLSPWQFAAGCWALVCAVAFLLLMFKDYQ